MIEIIAIKKNTCMNENDGKINFTVTSNNMAQVVNMVQCEIIQIF